MPGQAARNTAHSYGRAIFSQASRCFAVSFAQALIWDTYRFRGETVAGREPNNLMVEFRVYNVEKKIEVVYRLRKKAVTDPEAVYEDDDDGK